MAIGKTKEKTTNSQSYFSAGLKQIKESANFGLVFNGPDFNYGHYWEFDWMNKIDEISD